MREQYETISFDNVTAFLNALRRSNSQWLRNNSSLSHWAFRGHGNSDWMLTPTVWRPEIESDKHFQATLKTIDEEVIGRAIDANSELLEAIEINRENVRHQVAQRRFEYLQVRAFTDLADELGLSIPGGFLSNAIPREFVPSDSVFGGPHPAFALAQHHGIPTRFLDWTQNPLCAAFFAAEHAENQGDFLAVWAIDLSSLIDSTWCEFRVPRSQVGFLHSQAGLFTYNPTADWEFVVDGQWPRIEDQCSSSTLKKLVLPSGEAQELRRLLYAEGVSRVHLMPTLDNIKRTLDHMLRDRL